MLRTVFRAQRLSPLAWVVFLMTACSFPYQSDKASIVVLSPNGSELFYANTLAKITWSSSDEVSNIVSLFYSTDSGATWKYIGLDENDGSFSWYVPNEPSSNCFIKISDYADSTRFDVNDDPFTISGQSESGSLMLSHPNGGEVFSASSVEIIRWSTTESDSEIVSLFFSANNGISWTHIGLDENDGSFPWVVPDFNSEECLVRIQDYSNPQIEDISDSVFTITGGSAKGVLEIIYPNGGEVLTAGTARNIVWTSSGQVSNVISLSLSTDSGMTWFTIGNVGNVGSFPWTVPDVASTQSLIKIFDYSDSTIFDISDDTFIITTQNSSPLLHVTYPNGGEVFTSGSVETITWTSSGNVSEIVSLSVSTDNGSSWSSIGVDNNDGSFSWYVPDVESNSCLIKIEDYSDSTVLDVSDAPFSISTGGGTGTLRVDYPNGGEMLTGGTTVTVSWTSSGNVSSVVALEFSSDNGVTWSDIGLSQNSGAYSWTVPDIASPDCFVRISDYSNPLISDVSDGAFSISTGGNTVSDSLFYDALDNVSVATSFVGYGVSIPMYARVRFTPTHNFELTHVRAFYRTENSVQSVTLFVLSVATGNILQTVGYSGSEFSSVEGKFFLLPLPSPEVFEQGEEFYIVLAFRDVAYPMLATGTGTNGHAGRSYYSDDGNDWVALDDALGDGDDDAWVIRALSLPRDQKMASPSHARSGATVAIESLPPVEIGGSRGEKRRRGAGDNLR